MTKNDAKDYLPLVQALAAGKTIQIKISNPFIWTDIEEMSLVRPAADYRIKPEPREVWINDYDDGFTSYANKTRAEADTIAGKARKAVVRFVEAERFPV